MLTAKLSSKIINSLPNFMKVESFKMAFLRDNTWMVHLSMVNGSDLHFICDREEAETMRSIFVLSQNDCVVTYEQI
jgi:hypothetical protein